MNSSDENRDMNQTIHLNSCFKLARWIVALFVFAFAYQANASITATGSDSTFALVKKLADSFSEQSGVEFSLSGGGSSHGAQACIDAAVDFGFLSRKLKSSEISKGLTGYSYAMDGVAVVVNPQNPVSNLTLEELALIYSGENEWPDGKKVIPFNRNEDSGTREVFESTVLHGKAFREDAKISHDQLMLKQVSRIPTAIGYTSAFHVQNTVKVLEIEGVAPDHSHILDGSYPISRTLTLATRSDASEDVKAFVEFVLSAKGASIIEEAGYIPLHKASE